MHSFQESYILFSMRIYMMYFSLDVITSVSIFLAMFCHFAKTKCPKQHGQKKLPHFEEESYKITKIFGGFV